MDIKAIQNIKKYPYLGYSPNLIDYFLIIGFDLNFKTEKIKEIPCNLKEIILPKEKPDNPESENQNVLDKFSSHKIPNKPVILNSISSDFTDGMLNEETIINHMFPDNDTLLYISEKNEKNEPNSQNLIFYLSTERIFEKEVKDDAQNPEEKKLNKNINFNVFGYLFWEYIITDKIKVFFPKVLVFISQYSYFKYFSFLSQNILFRLKKKLYFEIPLEIQLYNIINYTPSPINCDLQLELLANIDLVSLKNKKDKELAKYPKSKEGEKGEKVEIPIPNDNNNITLLQLSGYPYFDIDLSHLFNYFNFESFFTTYLFSFLEFKMIFFSPSLDFLNTIMYIIRFLSYPIIDNKDLGQIYSISKDEFLYGSQILENNLIGVNCEYNQKLIIPQFYKDYFIISFDLKSITIFFNGQNISSFNSENSNNNETKVKRLINFIDNSIAEDIQKNAFLEKKINAMFTSLYQCFRTIMNNNNINNPNSQIKDFFKELDLNESNYKNYDYNYNEYDEYNSTIQKAFYSFNLSIYEFFHDTVVLNINSSEKHISDGYASANYSIKFDPINDKTLTEEEKIFLIILKKQQNMSNL